MRITEYIYYLNLDKEPSERYIREHFHHFYPNEEDYRNRKKYRKLLETPVKTKKSMQDLFD